MAVLCARSAFTTLRGMKCKSGNNLSATISFSWPVTKACFQVSRCRCATLGPAEVAIKHCERNYAPHQHLEAVHTTTNIRDGVQSDCRFP
eukprot:1675846-Amphidinium_carterae.1